MVQSSLKAGAGTGGGGTQAILFTAGDFPQALAVYATKGYSSCVSRREVRRWEVEVALGGWGGEVRGTWRGVREVARCEGHGEGERH